MEPIDTKTFLKEGFLVIENVCTPSDIDHLQLECGFLLELLGQQKSCVLEPVSAALLEQSPGEARWGVREYTQLRTRYPLGKQTLEIIFSENIRQIVEALVGSDARLFNEQFIVKPQRSGMEGCFGWHRDSDSLEETHAPYISIWIALDDMTVDNGCLIVQDRGAPRALEISKGSAVIMSHLVMHKSGENTTRFQRRAWMPQFSKGPIVVPSIKGDVPVSLAIPM